jgi:type IV pilus assembly protein PilV
MNRSTKPRPQRQRRARRGFTLVSMIVALVLLTVGLMSLASANAQTVTLQTVAQNRTNAIAIGRAYLEEMRTRDPWDLESEPAVKLNADGLPSSQGAYTRTVTVTVVRQNLVNLEVRVDFPRASKPVLLTTSIFRGNGLAGAP